MCIFAVVYIVVIYIYLYNNLNDELENESDDELNNYKDRHFSVEHSIEYILPPIVTREDIFKRLKGVYKDLTIFKKFKIVKRRENREISQCTVTVPLRGRNGAV